jgi:hypothetical protein
VTDLDQRIHEHLERLLAGAPLPPSVQEIRARRRGARRRPVLVGLAAVVLVAAVVGGVALRQTSGEGGRDGAPASIPAATDPDVIVYLRPRVTDAQIVDVERRLRAEPSIVDIEFFDQDRALEEFRRLFADDPALVESVTPDVLPPSFRLVVLDHDVEAIAPLLDDLESAPGVQQVDRDPVLPEPATDLEIPTCSTGPASPGDHTSCPPTPDSDGSCSQMHLPADLDGDGVAESCIRARDMPADG